MTSLKEKLKKLPPDKIAELELIVDRIVKTQLAEMIVLYGSHARGDFKNGRIVDFGGSRVQRRSDYDILVVVDQPGEEREIDKIYKGFARPKRIGGSEVKIRRELRGLDLPVQVIVEQIEEINRRLEDRQYFYSDIKREGIVLYDTGRCRLADPPDKISPTVRRQYAEDEFEGWFGLAKSFLKFSKYGIDENELKLTSFHLEQVCEMCLQVHFTGLHPLRRR